VKIRRGVVREEAARMGATLPTLRFGKATDLFTYIEVFFNMEFGATRGAVESSVTKRKDEDRLLVLESEDFLEHQTDRLASIHDDFLGLSAWATRTGDLCGFLVVDFG
jgi:hypothetical protein